MELISTVHTYEPAVGPLAECVRLHRCFVALLLSLMASGCITLHHGVAPGPDGLAELSIGECRQSDVLLVLGKPRGKGAANVSPEFDRRSIWFYEHVESDAKTVRVKMLLVYFVGDVYDSHLWFGSVEDISS